MASRKRKIRRRKVEELVKYILRLFSSKCKKIEIAGSFRRKKQWVGDLEFVVAGISIDKIIRTLKRSKKLKIKEILWQGRVKTALIVNFGKLKNVQLEFYQTPLVSWGAMMLTRTGPSTLNIYMRSKAKKKGLKLNEYGLWKEDKRIAGKTEKSIFEKLKIPYMTPEEREEKFGE